MELIIDRTCREGKHGSERVVFFQHQGPKVPDRIPNQPSHHGRLLEDHRQRQGDLPKWKNPSGHEENSGVLQGEGSQGREDELGDA